MNGISFRIYKTPQHNTWTLSYKTGTHRYEAVFISKSDAIQASYHRAAVAMEA